MVLKGKVSGILNDGTAVTVTPYGGGVVTMPLTVPYFLVGVLDVNTPVVYMVFEDNTGLVLSRMDGAVNTGLAGGNISAHSEGDAIIITTRNGG